MSTSPNAPYLWIIDTADYAGNFERDLCAYITGRIGECEVGQDMAKLFAAETGQQPFENVIQESDDHGCCRPVIIYQTPGTFSNGLGGHFNDGQEKQALAHYKQVAASIYGGYAKAPQAHLKVLAGKDEVAKAELARLGWNVASCKREIARYEKQIADAQALTKTPKYPGAYQSVAISFETKPTKEQVELMKERAAQFAALAAKTYGGPPRGQRISKILGFRLIKQTVKRKTEEIDL